MNVNRTLQTVIDMCAATESSETLPADISLSDMKATKAVLTKWNDFIKSENQKLSETATELRSQRRNLYTKSSLQQERFFLSGVIVHQGQAGAGHYWVYILKGESWWRINDNDVKKVEFFDIEKESFGGASGSSSAYILVYQKDGGTVITDELAPALDSAVKHHDEQQAQRASEANRKSPPVPDWSEPVDDPYSVNVMHHVPAFSNTEASPLDIPALEVATEESDMDVDEVNVVSSNLTSTELEYSQQFDAWLQGNCRNEKTRFYKNHFIDSLTYDLQTKRQLKFAAFLDENGKTEFLRSFWNEVKNKELIEQYRNISKLHALHACTFEDMVQALFAWDNGRWNTMDDVIRALQYAETAIFDQIWFTELNDIGCDEIEHSYFYDALSRILFDATNKIMDALSSAANPIAHLKELNGYLNLFLYLSKSINSFTEYRDDTINNVKQRVDFVRGKWLEFQEQTFNTELDNAKGPMEDFIGRLFLEDCQEIYYNLRSREDESSWKLKEDPNLTMQNYSSLKQQKFD